MDTDKVMLNVDEVARLLDVSSRHIRRLADSNQFPKPVRLGGCVRWHRSVVEQFLKSLAVAVEQHHKGDQ
jgi:excisionase family DNA binding protein